MRRLVLKRTLAVAALGTVICGGLLLAALALSRLGPPAALVFGRFEAERGRFWVYLDPESGATLERYTPLHDARAAVPPFEPEPRSPDGRRRVMPRITPDGVDLFIADESGHLTQLTHLADFPAGSRPDWQMRSNTYPLWSPNGRWITFLSAGPEARLDLYRIDANGLGLRRLYVDAASLTPLNLHWVAMPEQPFSAGLALAALLGMIGVFSAWAWLKARPAV